MDYWPYFVGPIIIITVAGLSTWNRWRQMQYLRNRNQNQQNATTLQTGQPQTQNLAPQSNFSEISTINRERLQKTDVDPVNFTSTSRTQKIPQTVIMMPIPSEMPKGTKMSKPSKAQNYNPKEKLPHFCKAPNDGDMIKRY